MHRGGRRSARPPILLAGQHQAKHYRVLRRLIIVERGQPPRTADHRQPPTDPADAWFMKFERNEILTGLLVVVTLGILVGVILLLAAPGVFKQQDT